MLTKLIFSAIGLYLIVVSLIRPFYVLLLILIINRFNLFIASYGYEKTLTVSRFIGIFVALGWLVNSLLRGHSKYKVYKKLNNWLILFVTSGIVSSLFAEYKLPSLLLAFRIGLLVIMVLFIEDFVRDRYRLSLLVKVVAISAGVAGVLGVLQYISYNFLGLKIGEIEAVGNVYGPRLAGFVNNPNGFGAILMSGIPFLLYLFITEKSKMIYLILLLFSLISLMMTLSRTHIFGFVIFITLFMVLGLSKKLIKKKYLINTFIIGVLTSAVFYVTPHRVYDRLINYTFSGYDSSRQIREIIIKKGIYLFFRKPILGIGYDNLQRIYVDLYPTRQGSHDFISFVLASTGILGFTFLLISILVSVRKYIFLFRRIHFLDVKYQFLILISFAGFLEILSTFFGNVIVLQRIFWIYLVLPFIVIQIVKIEDTTKVNEFDENKEHNAYKLIST